MSHKDYQLIAGALAAEQPRPIDHSMRPRESTITQGVIESIAERLADALAADNPRFDRARFLAACGGAEE